MSNSTIKKIDSIQFLRALAVFLVVYVHVIDSAKEFNPLQTQFFYLENWGAIGLDLFYVISGFIMTVVTPSYVKSRDWKSFLVKRVLRIIPVYWALSLLSVGIQLLNQYTYPFEKVMKTLLFFPFFDTEFVFPIIPVGWSLSFEIYFYCLIAILLTFAGEKIYRYLIASLIALSVAGYFSSTDNQLLKFLLSPLMIEFAIGVVAGMVYRKISKGKVASSRLRSVAIFLTVTGSLLMLTTLFTGMFGLDEAAYVVENSKRAFLRSLILGIPSGIFLMGVVLLENQYAIKVPAFFTALGDASYSCYLIHPLLLIPLARKLYIAAKINNGDFYIGFAMLMAVAGSLIFYKYVEKGLNLAVNKAYSRSAMLITAPVAKQHPASAPEQEKEPLGS